MGHSPALFHSRVDSGHNGNTCEPETEAAVGVGRVTVVQSEWAVVRVAAAPVRVESVPTVQVLVIAKPV